MHVDPRHVKALFNSALDLSEPADRPAFLDRECGDDHELRQRVGDLLAAFDQPASALERPLAAVAQETIALAKNADQTRAEPDQPLIDDEKTSTVSMESPPPAALIGSIIAGRYKLRQEIGEGGMGSVYLAEQTQPVKRKVALKLIKAGMDSRTVLARFESERQALALMDHPNIARVLDAGTTESGHPFFVMDLVKGIPLTDYCDQHCLDLLQRLTLFRQICSAVQHAHQKGIIHRDLKPSNILVECHDGHPVPKVIDFGLAKATSGLRLSEQSLFTAFGTVAGTPLYMAPEQAAFNALDVDTRADIYALGVILYELLTGSTPIKRETFQKAALAEMLRVIREVEPPTPSSRISTSQGLPTIAASRQIEPARLGRYVRGDLDWIVMKALAKERQRRYESPIAFANDIERFLAHEPVSAGPPTAAYRIKKFIRRYRPQVIAASLLLLVLVGGVVGTTLGLIEARKQQRIAHAESLKTEEARNAEATERREAEHRLAQVEKANDILGSIFKDLNPLSAEKDGKPLIALLGEHLDQATAQIEGDVIGDPLAVAQMQYSLGRAQRGLGYPEKTIVLLTKARATFTARLGPDHPDTLASMGNLAEAYDNAGQVDRAVPLYKEALALMQAKLDTADPQTIHCISQLSLIYIKINKFDEGLSLGEQALTLSKLKFGPEDAKTLGIMDHLAIGYHLAGQYRRSVPLFEEVVRGFQITLGPDHPDTLGSTYNIALAYSEVGQLGRALPLLEEMLRRRRAKLGPDHPDTISSLERLGTVYKEAGQIDQGVPLLEESYNRSEAKYGADNSRSLVSMINLGSAYIGAGQLDLALSLLEEGLKLCKSQLGADNPNTFETMNSLALAYRSAGKLDLAVPLMGETLKLRTAKLGPEHPGTFDSMNSLALGYRDAGELDKALPLLEETLKKRTVKLGPEHPQTLERMNGLALAYRDAGKVDRVLPFLRKMVEHRKQQSGADSPKYVDDLATLGDNLLDQSKWIDAEPILREALAFREAKQPDVWTTFETRSLLGGALLGQKTYTETEPLLTTGYEGMKKRASRIPFYRKKCLSTALDRLIALAEATNKPDDVKKWKDERAKLPSAVVTQVGEKAK
jgi:serine/threonine protein kinase